MIKIVLKGGIIGSEDGTFTYYFGHQTVVSGRYSSTESAENGLQAEFDSAVSQFGEKYAVTLNRKDILK